VQQTTTDGVATLWEDGPAPLTAALMFRVGARHETFRTLQVTHLVEHLVMGSLPKSHLDCNAHVTTDTTTFVASGRPEQVADFLGRVCRALTDLPTDRLAREQGVLRAEDANGAHPALCWAAGLRYGHDGLGLLNSLGPGAGNVTEQHVRDFAVTHFVRENAVLVLTGPPPEGLRLPLPSGPRPVEPPPVPTGLPTPALMRVPPHAVLSFVLPRQEWATSVARILVERVVDDVRHGRGLAYEIDFDAARVDADHTVVAVFSDGQDEHADTIAEALWDALGALAQDGPTPEELAHHLGGFTAYVEDPRASADWMEGLGYRHLYGDPLPDRATALGSLSRMTADDVRRWAEQARATAVLGAPPSPDGEPLAGLPDRTEWLPDPAPGTRDGERHGRRLLSLSPRDLCVTAGPGGLSQTVRGSTVAGSWEDVVGVARADGLRLVHLRSGNSMLLSRRDLKNADRLLAFVDERTGPVAYESTEDEILGSG
jgi:predicted Zn-dependent peptidase